MHAVPASFLTALVALAGLRAGQDAATAPDTSPADRRERAIRELEQMIRRTKLPGLSIAVIEDGAIAWARGFGVREAGKEAPIDEATLFQAASISKPVAALGALILAERGELDLDTDVNEMLTRWKLPQGNGSDASRVTPRHLMSHTAGLTVHGFPGYAIDAKRPTLAQILDGEAPAKTAAIGVEFPVGASRYSGGGYTVLQMLMEDVAERPFEELLRELVLEPLGMERSTFAQPLPELLQANAASGHRSSDQGRQAEPVPGRWHVYPERAAAGLWTTPSDLARFLIAVRAAARGEKRSVLSEDTAREMLTPQFGTSSGLGPSLTFTGDEVVAFGHGGTNRGFRCDATMNLQTGDGVVVMLHSDNGAPLSEARLIVSTNYEWVREVHVDLEILESYEGKYRLNSREVFDLRLQNGQLTAQLTGQRRFPVYPASQTKFFYKVVDAQITLVRNEQGEVTALILHQNGRNQRAGRIGD